MAGLHFLHLQCHLGLDTLAWAKAGATVTGLDFSASAIAAAEEIAGRAGLTGRARFVCSNAYEASKALGGEVYDIVYVSLARFAGYLTFWPGPSRSECSWRPGAVFISTTCTRLL